MRNADAKTLLEAINKVTFKRRPFVAQFMQDITRVISAGKDITPKQAKVLEAIYRDTQGGGQYEKREMI